MHFAINTVYLSSTYSYTYLLLPVSPLCMQFNNSLLVKLNLKMRFVLFTLFPLALCTQSFSTRQALTHLDQSFDKDTSLRGPCDLILLTRIKESQYDGYRAYYALSTANTTLNFIEHLAKSESHCLILVTSGNLKLEQLLHHGRQIQMIRPVAVLMTDNPKWLNDTATFPTLNLTFLVFILHTYFNRNFNNINIYNGT